MTEPIDMTDWQEISCDKCGYITAFDQQWEEDEKKCMFCNPTPAFKEWQKNNRLT